MAARLTDKQKKKIIADYVQLESYNAVAKLNGVSHQTVKRIVSENPEMDKKLQQKKEQNTADIIACMDSQKDDVSRSVSPRSSQRLSRLVYRAESAAR